MIRTFIISSDNPAVEGGLSEDSLKRGSESIANGTDEVSVTFSQVFDDVGYSIVANIVNSTDSPSSVYSYSVKTKTTTGFTVLLSGVVDSANYVLDWTAVDQS